MSSTKILQKISKEDFASVILGIRKKLNLSILELAYALNLSPDSILRYEKKRQYPKKSAMNRTLEYIENQGLDIPNLLVLGSQCNNSFVKDTVLPKLDLKHNKELAELIGIILGDGEITKDGIRISFDPKKDKNYLYRRVFPLIKELLGFNVYFESYKRSVVYSIPLVRYLEEDCKIKQGSKSKNNTSIPDWCLENKDYCKAVLRGLFDTDGYFAYSGSLEIMFGRFSDKCTHLVNSIMFALESLNFKPIVAHTKDGRYRIRLTSKKEVTKFFSVVGTSNLKHIVRCLLWKLKGYKAKIELEGLNALVRKTNETIGYDVRSYFAFLFGAKN